MGRGYGPELTGMVNQAYAMRRGGSSTWSIMTARDVQGARYPEELQRMVGR